MDDNGRAQDKRLFALLRGGLRAAAAAILSLLGFILDHTVGRLSWQPPRWVARIPGTARGVAETLVRRRRMVILLLLLGGAAWWAKPVLQTTYRQITYSGAAPTASEAKTITASVTAPGRTEIENDGSPRPIIVDFSAPAAPLARVGKEALNVSLEPAHPGKWQWATERRLEFLPAEDWPVGGRFKIRLGDKALAAHVALKQPTLDVQTPAFELKVASAQFYQDPVQPSQRKAVFNIRFSHPVQPAEFEKRVLLVYGYPVNTLLDAAEPNTKFTVTYDKFKLNASVQSETLAIPQQASTMLMRITAGVPAQRGGEPTGREVSEAISVPGLNGLAVEKIESSVVTGESGEPEHVLHVQSSMAIHEREMARMVSAWSLPARDGGKSAAPRPWEDPADVTEAVLKRATRVTLTPVVQEKEADETHAFRFKAEPNSYLFVRVQRGLKSVGGYQLGEKQEAIVRVRAFAPELAIMSRGSLLALNGEKKLPILVRDLPGVHLEIGRLLPHQLHLLATQGQGSFSKPEFYQGITPDDLTERFEKKIPLKLAPGKSHYETVDFANYLKSEAGDRRGIFLLTVRGYDPKTGAVNHAEQVSRPAYEGEGEGEGEGYPEEQAEAPVDPLSKMDRRLVLVTDLGFVVKKAQDGSQDVFVQSIANGSPVGDATVEVWGKNGLVLTAQKTNAGGRAHLPNLLAYTREKMPVLLVVKKAGDTSFMPLNRHDRGLELSRFDVGGAYSTGLPNQMRAYLFSDRGIYRPGDTMHIGIIARSSDWAQSLKDLPVEAEIIDARGLVAKREKLKLGPSGMAEVAYTTLDTSPTGNYTIHLNLARDNGKVQPGTVDTAPLRLGSATVKVQEFMPDRMKVGARLSAEVAEGWVHPQNLKASVNVKNLFGTPAQNRRVESTLTLTPAYPAFRSYADYIFFDPQRAKERHVEQLGRSDTDTHGEAEIDLGLQRFQAATFQLHLLVKAFEPEGGRSVAAEATALVSELPYLIGYKADGDLGYVSRGGTRQVSLLAIDPTARKTAVSGLKLLHIERKVLSVLVRQNNGLYKYESRKKEVVLREDALALPAAGKQLALATDVPGNFAYVIRNADGMEVNRIEYSVAGSGNVSRSLDRNAELQMTLNKKDYQPGEEIEISIRAPYAGAGLITIERDRVFTHQWFKTDKTASVQKITLPKDYEGNGYVMVQFVRDPSSDEVYMSPLSYGVAPFTTSLAKRITRISLHAPQLIKPGQTVKMRLESPQAARAVVFAVDEGILQVAGYQNANPLQFFFQKRALEVTTQQTLDLILPEFKKLMQTAAPGGDAESMQGKHLNPFKRKGDKPVVYWSGIVDVNGSKEFSYTVPESFNGALRVMAVAANDSSAGVAATKTLVRGDLIVLPTVPVALTPGDEVDIGVGLANNVKGSGKDAPVTLSLQASPHLEVVGPAEQVLKVAERGEASTKFRIRARSGAQAQLGSASVVFTAQYKDAKARLSTDLSVRPASPFVTLVQTGRLSGNGEIPLQGKLYSTLQRNELAVSSSPWGFASGLMQYLVTYPHGCTEQITSQTFPSIILSTRPELAKELLATAGKRKAGDESAPDPRKGFERTLSMLRSRQTGDGGFGLYSPDATHPFATVYATHMLIEARERKLPVPEDMYQRVLLYLQQYASRAEGGRYEWRNRSYAAYLLTRQGIVTTAMLSNLRSAMKTDKSERGAADLGAAYLAASYQMLKQDALAQELLEPVWQDLQTSLQNKRGYSYWDYYYDPLVHDAQLLFLVARHFPARLKQLPPQALDRIGKMVQDGYYHSLSSASVVLAVDAYSTALAEAAASGVSVAAVDRQGKTQELPLAPPTPLARTAVPVDTVRLRLGYAGKLPLYYSVAETGYERDIPASAEAKGLEIARDFLDGSGNPVTEARLGDELTVRIRVHSTDRWEIPQVALVDVLPGGLEPVLTSPGDSSDPNEPLWRKRLGGSGSWSIDYADIREDRVIFYGNVTRSSGEITYKVRATNIGEFVVPAAWGEAMYDRKTYARSAGGKFSVKPLAK